VPQVTAIADAARARKKFTNKFVLADGGAANSGDIVKALACGSDAIIAGSLFAGTEEAPGKIIHKDGVMYKEYNGSTSKTEKMKQVSKDKEGKSEHYIIHVEGVEAMVQYKGPVRNIVEDLCAGIRSGFTYSGATDVRELWKNAQFIQITNAGYRESTPHDVILR
jgi:IMP dehydrogenase